MNNSMNERFYQDIYLDDYVLKFSNDNIKIPYLTTNNLGDNNIYLIDGKKTKSLDENNKFNRRPRNIENSFMNDYFTLSRMKNENRIKNFNPLSTGRHILNLIEQLKTHILKSFEQNEILQQDEEYEILPNLTNLSPRLHINFTYRNENNYPYRSIDKIYSLYDNIDNNKLKHYNNFNIKKNKLKYSLKTYSIYKHSYIGDIFFQSKVSAFLLLININTRYAYAYQLGTINDKQIINVDENNEEHTLYYATSGKKTTTELLKAFDKFLMNHKINILRFDGETALKSKRFKKYFEDKHIKFIPTIPNIHSSLGLIDRLSRTIRDIAFNLNIEGIYTSEIMNIILDYYNNSRHETLTKMLFEADPNLIKKYPKGISPLIVNYHDYLEKLYVEECIKYNYHIITQKDYKINIDDVVKIVNKKESLIDENKINSRTILSKDDYKVINQIGNNYELINLRTNKRVFRPRYEIKKL